MFERILRKIRKQEWRYALGALILAGSAVLAAVGYWWYLSPKQITIAVAAWGSAEGRVIEAYGQALAEQNKDIRLKLVPYADVRRSAQALQDKTVDLAIVRPDVFLPNNGLTVAILREEAVIIVALGSDIKNMAGLAKKQLAVVTHHAADLSAIRTVLAHYDLDRSLTLMQMTAGDLEEALKGKRIDAVAFVAAPASRDAFELVQMVAQSAAERVAGNAPAPKAAGERAAPKAPGGEAKNEDAENRVTIVAIEQSEALALKMPMLTQLKIPPGTLSGRPKLPAEEVATVAVSKTALMAGSASLLDRGPLSETDPIPFPDALAHCPDGILRQSPDRARRRHGDDAALPNHPGALDYYKREQLTFDGPLWGLGLGLGLLFGGSLSSGVAWAGQFFIRAAGEPIDEILHRLMCILSEARAARTVAELDALALEIDSLVTHAGATAPLSPRAP